jgi:hypothetical protein
VSGSHDACCLQAAAEAEDFDRAEELREEAEGLRGKITEVLGPNVNVVDLILKDDEDGAEAGGEEEEES